MAVGVGLVLTSGTAAAAATGVRPDQAQHFAHKWFEKVGRSVPDAGPFIERAATTDRRGAELPEARTTFDGTPGRGTCLTAAGRRTGAYAGAGSRRSRPRNERGRPSRLAIDRKRPALARGRPRRHAAVAHPRDSCPAGRCACHLRPLTPRLRHPTTGSHPGRCPHRPSGGKRSSTLLRDSPQPTRRPGAGRSGVVPRTAAGAPARSRATSRGSDTEEPEMTTRITAAFLSAALLAPGLIAGPAAATETWRPGAEVRAIVADFVASHPGRRPVGKRPARPPGSRWWRACAPSVAPVRTLRTSETKSATRSLRSPGSRATRRPAWRARAWPRPSWRSPSSAEEARASPPQSGRSSAAPSATRSTAIVNLADIAAEEEAFGKQIRALVQQISRRPA